MHRVMKSRARIVSMFPSSSSSTRARHSTAAAQTVAFSISSLAASHRRDPLRRSTYLPRSPLCAALQARSPLLLSPSAVSTCDSFSSYHFSTVSTASASATTSSVASTRNPPRLIVLNNLRDLPGSRQQKKRLGRGTGSGLGKTAGRGHKGSKARNSRGLKPWFIGGQTPLYQLFPKRGFKSLKARLGQRLLAVNLDDIHEAVTKRRIDGREKITMKTLVEAGLVSKGCKYGVKLLARGFRIATLNLPYQTPSSTVSSPMSSSSLAAVSMPTIGATTKPSVYATLQPLHIEVTDASLAAKRALEAAGGQLTLVWHNRVTLRAHLKPEKFTHLPARAPLPPPKLRDKYERQVVGGEISVRNKRLQLLHEAETATANVPAPISSAKQGKAEKKNYKI